MKIGGFRRVGMQHKMLKMVVRLAIHRRHRRATRQNKACHIDFKERALVKSSWKVEWLAVLFSRKLWGMYWNRSSGVAWKTSVSVLKHRWRRSDGASSWLNTNWRRFYDVSFSRSRLRFSNSVRRSVSGCVVTQSDQVLCVTRPLGTGWFDHRQTRRRLVCEIVSKGYLFSVLSSSAWIRSKRFGLLSCATGQKNRSEGVTSARRSYP